MRSAGAVRLFSGGKPGVDFLAGRRRSATAGHCDGSARWRPVPAEIAPTLDTVTTARVWGISSDCLWDLARKEAAPVAPLRLGTRLRWPAALVAESVGLSIDALAAFLDEGTCDTVGSGANARDFVRPGRDFKPAAVVRAS